MESCEHKLLKQVALRWVQQTGCVAFVQEINLGYAGIIDVAGIKRNGDIYAIEAKVSQSDFNSDFKQKKRRQAKIGRLMNDNRWIDFLYYITADGIDTSLLDTSIGLLDENGRLKRRGRRRDIKSIERHNGKAIRFERFARTASWRAYANVINGGKEQLEFALD